MLKSLTSLPQEPEFLNVAKVNLVYQYKVKPKDRFKVASSRQAYELLMKIYDHQTIEHREFFWAVYLNTASHAVGAQLIGMGGIAGTVVDIRTVYQGALLTNATRIIISHNHPSGRLVPSDADIKITQNISNAGKMLEIELMDHLIVTLDGYYSFADEGRI